MRPAKPQPEAAAVWVAIAQARDSGVVERRRGVPARVCLCEWQVIGDDERAFASCRIEHSADPFRLAVYTLCHIGRCEGSRVPSYPGDDWPYSLYSFVLFGLFRTLSYSLAFFQSSVLFGLFGRPAHFQSN
jgi:hypothetical protein